MERERVTWLLKAQRALLLLTSLAYKEAIRSVSQRLLRGWYHKIVYHRLAAGALHDLAEVDTRTISLSLSLTLSLIGRRKSPIREGYNSIKQATPSLEHGHSKDYSRHGVIKA